MHGFAGAGGRVRNAVTSPEIHEARFEEPRCSVVIRTTKEEDEVREAPVKLARAAVEYSAGGGGAEGGIARHPARACPSHH
jgi:hypothetical protein